MPGCCAFGCTNRHDKGFKLYRFPSDLNRRTIWENKINRLGWKPNSSSKLCEAHFDAYQFESERADQKRRLKYSAVPTIFCHRSTPKPRKPPKKRGGPTKEICSPKRRVTSVLGDHSYAADPQLQRLPISCVKMASRRALKAVLIDLSGTLHIEDAAVPGAQDALSRLRQASVAVKFVTNTTKESKRNLLERLQRLNFDLQEKEIFTSLSAARSLLEKTKHRPLLLVEESALEDFTGIDTSEPNAVVIGLAPDHFNYQTMNKAFRLILDGAPLFAIHKARYYKRKDGLALGPGPFVTGLEYATDCQATVVGKPEKTFFTQALADLGCSPDEAVMIGDDARDDVGGAQSAGMLGILVRTGKYRQGDENKIDPPPHLTCDSFPDAVEHILKNLL